ncbi:MAG: hypothetical protein ACFB14_19885 [Leptolyngbyaceae cyanobacterium]
MIYDSIPSEGRIYTRLQQEKYLNILMRVLLIYNGPFYFLGLSHDEREELLAEIIDTHLELFGSRLNFDRAVADLRLELTNARQLHPGIEKRFAVLENSATRIEKRLGQELRQRNVPNVNKLTRRLIDGDQDFAPGLLSYQPLKLHSPKLISEGVSFLTSIKPEMLFSKNEEHLLEDFHYWRCLYLDAHINNEVILSTCE